MTLQVDPVPNARVLGALPTYKSHQVSPPEPLHAAAAAHLGLPLPFERSRCVSSVFSRAIDDLMLASRALVCVLLARVRFLARVRSVAIDLCSSSISSTMIFCLDSEGSFFHDA